MTTLEVSENSNETQTMIREGMMNGWQLGRGRSLAWSGERFARKQTTYQRFRGGRILNLCVTPLE